MTRSALLAPILAMSALFAADAGADVGPPPKCEAGTHDEYLFGHHCVPDGSHLERDPNGGIKVVSSTPSVTQPVSPAASSSSPSPVAPPSSAPAAPPSSSPPTPAPTAAPPASTQRPPPGCACGLTGAPSYEGGAALTALAALIGLARGRRRARRY